MKKWRPTWWQKILLWFVPWTEQDDYNDAWAFRGLHWRYKRLFGRRYYVTGRSVTRPPMHANCRCITVPMKEAE